MLILAIMAIIAEKLLYQNGQSCGQFMFLSQEWPNSRNIQKELGWYHNPVKSYDPTTQAKKCLHFMKTANEDTPIQEVNTNFDKQARQGIVC